MASDWVGYLKLLKEQAAARTAAAAPAQAGNGLDLLGARPGRDPDGDFWSRFKGEATRSSFREALSDVVEQVESLPRRTRLAVAVAIARILGPIEWPPAWEAERAALVSAIGGLLDATTDLAPTGPDFSLQDAREQDARVTAHVGLLAAREMFRHPCRRDEVRLAAMLCNVASAVTYRAFHRLMQAAPAGADDAMRQAQSRLDFAMAWATYIRATEKMNDAIGSVVFHSVIPAQKPTPE